MRHTQTTRTRVIRLTAAGLALAALGSALAAPPDAIMARLEAAKAQHDAAIERHAEKLVAALNKAAAEARAKGDTAAAEALERQRAAFEDGTLPGLLPADAESYRAGVREADRKLTAAYKAAAEACRSRAQYEQSRAIEEELELLNEAQSEPLWTGLLDTIQLPRDAAGGDSKRAGGTIAFSGAQGRGVLRIPLSKLPPEYELELLAARTRGKGDLQIGFKSGAARGLLIIDGFGGEVSGISLVDGRDADQNPTAHHGAVFKDAAPVTLMLSVDRDRIIARADGERFIDWSGKPASITLPEGLRSESGALFIVASAGSDFRLESLRIRPRPLELATKPAPKPPAPPPPKPAPTPPAANDPLPAGLWAGRSDTNFNGRGGRGTCTVRVRRDSGDEFSIRFEDDTTSSEWELNGRVNGNSLTITGGDLKRRGNLNIAKSGRLAVWLSGSGRVDGQTLRFSFSGKCDAPHKKGLGFQCSAEVRLH